jgi:cell division protein FtsB
MKWLMGVLIVSTVLLQYRLWLSDDGVREYAHMRDAVLQQREANAGLATRNQQLVAEVADLKKGMTALEERARSDLGMVTANETFFQVVPRAIAPAADVRTHTALR